jgi:hypothetical protein
MGENPYDFPEIVKVLKEHDIRIPHERELEELNKARILIQHYGTVPDENDVRRLVSVAKDFLIDFWWDTLGVNYAEVSLVALISDENAKKSLEEAYELFMERKCEESARKAAMAIQMVKWRIEEKLRPSRFRHKLWMGNRDVLRKLGLDELYDVIEDMERDIEFVLDITLSTPFASNLRKIREITGVVFLRTIGGKIIAQKLGEHESTAEEAEYCLETALEFILWAEQVYG